jgi:transposase
MMRTHPTQLDYFHEAIRNQPLDESACMEWPFTLTHHGYGCLNYRANAESPWKNMMTHRLAYIVCCGPIPPGRWCICHHCDNPKCFRPSHLFLGTDAANHRDCIRKGRRVNPDQRGEANGNNKLTEAQIREMNALYLSGRNKTDIAKQFGVTAVLLSRIAKRKAWAHLTDLSWDGIKHKLSDRMVREMNVLFHKGITQRAIADRYGISVSQMERIAGGKDWTHLTDLSWTRDRLKRIRLA